MLLVHTHTLYTHVFMLHFKFLVTCTYYSSDEVAAEKNADSGNGNVYGGTWR